ncbi:AP2 domain-containing protein [Acetobacterium bakii]|uniref:AP2 domain-containing protein n=1 Tax=Acetobacterium bakii TaxID=52689 RepID=UPI0006806A38|nr:AP2 domain-containing protein [Acetobacterium bakii]
MKNNIYKGQRFGQLVAIEETEKIGKDPHLAWRCQCDCGNIIITRGYLLTGGKKTDCGCITNRAVNILGERFGRLMVIAPAGLDKYKNAQWLCRCDCGTEKVIQGVALRRGAVQSCGCLKLEKKANILYERKKNFKIATTNISGCRGVSWNTQANKWIANITVNGKRIYLGLDSNLEKAIKLRKDAEEKYYKPVIEKNRD